MKNLSLKSFVVAAFALAALGWWGWSQQHNPQRLLTIDGNISDVAVSKNHDIILCTHASQMSRPKRYENLILIGKDNSVQQIKTTGWNAQVQQVKFSSDGQRIIGSSQWGVWIGDIQNGAIARQVVTSPQTSKGLKYWKLRLSGPLSLHRDGSIWSISSGMMANGPLTITRWNTNDASFIKEKIVESSRKGDFVIGSTGVSSDGTLALIAWNGVKREKDTNIILANGMLELWDMSSRRRLRELETVKPNGLGTPFFSEDNKFVAMADSAGRGYVWETRSGQLVQTLSGLRHRIKNEIMSVSGGFADRWMQRSACLAFAPDNRALYAGINDGTIVSYDLESGLPTKVLARLGQPVTKLICSLDGKQLVFITQNQTLYRLPLRS